ncbi:probable (S)-N-methylcoclaurine 3'-hydroxylase isozyme 2 [Coffea eugenioides]|uniref:probable (S)-N-methylcoclaurine 3'-hydroxylase isozyme 2 n=1 Tax=Coffea eugenioides TaxID=49369 RepID=UPI000F612989|nr:probable (S)-N-methylcoclaurine 3'-hydroxylase isozyme 2 [Coffea eugenioides]
MDSTANSFIFLPLFLLPPLFWLILNYIKSRNQSLPPGPKPWPIVGNLPQIGSKPHVALAQLAQDYGPLISLRLGSQLVVVGSTPAAATEILKTHDRILSGRHVPHVSYAKSPLMNYVSVGWTYECTDQWRFLRTLCKSEILGAKVIENQSHLREQKANELVQFLVSKEGQRIKIAEVVFVSVFNFLGQIFFSKDFISYDEVENGGGMSELIREVMELWTAPNISDLYPVLGGLDLQRLSKKASVCHNKICSAWQEIIRERRGKKYQDSTRQKDFLDVLLQNDFSDDQINYLHLELFAAGSDTSTSTVEWAMAELLRNPKFLDMIRQELDQIEFSGENVIKESGLTRLPYLQACVKEILRLHPPAPLLLPRRATETCQVMNYTIPMGTEVLVNVWAIGRDPNIWEDPSSFNPERFLSRNLDFKGNDFEFLPFGAGRRMCPGLPMAARQVCLTLASLIYHFEWSLPDNMLPQHMDMSEKFGITLQKQQPLVIMLSRRK